jgi:hypothetical protein
MPKAQDRSIRDEIYAAAAEEPPRVDWLRQMSEADRQEILAIKSEWKEGKFAGTGRGVARAIHRVCKSRGIAVISAEGIRNWLNKDL